MKIAISATGDNLDSMVNPQFGRCQYFIIINPDTMDFEAMPNGSTMVTGGAGIQAAQSIAHKDIDGLLTGDIGPNAFQTLSVTGIKVITGVNGTVREAIEQYKIGTLKPTMEATVPVHAGMGPRSGMKRKSGRGAPEISAQSPVKDE
jgi:predicted Fe-Mo cluster-binding NifX family protein